MFISSSLALSVSLLLFVFCSLSLSLSLSLPGSLSLSLPLSLSLSLLVFSSLPLSISPVTMQITRCRYQCWTYTTPTELAVQKHQINVSSWRTAKETHNNRNLDRFGGYPKQSDAVSEDFASTGPSQKRPTQTRNQHITQTAIVVLGS